MFLPANQSIVRYLGRCVPYFLFSANNLLILVTALCEKEYLHPPGLQSKLLIVQLAFIFFLFLALLLVQWSIV